METAIQGLNTKDTLDNTGDNNITKGDGDSPKMAGRRPSNADSTFEDFATGLGVTKEKLRELDMNAQSVVRSIVPEAVKLIEELLKESDETLEAAYDKQVRSMDRVFATIVVRMKGLEKDGVIDQNATLRDKLAATLNDFNEELKGVGSV